MTNAFKEQYDEGFKHSMQGGKESDNPYKPSGHERDTTFEDERHYQWYSGFWDGYEEKTKLTTEIKFSGPCLKYDDFQPYININFQTRLTLDKEYHKTLEMHDENVLNILVAEYRQVLEQELKNELKKYGL